MELMERVREIGADAAQLTDAGLDGARQTLLREIAREEHAAATAPRARWIGGAALAGGVAAAVIAVTVLAPSPQAVPSAAAAEVLRRAADVTIDAVDTTLQDGQYLRIEQTFDSVGYPDDGTDVRVLYVPADRSKDWFYDWGDVKNPSGFAEQGIERLPAGEFRTPEWYVEPQSDPATSRPYVIDVYRPFYHEMPRDPQALLDWFRARGGEPDEPGGTDDWVLSGFEDPLSINLMPPDLRAAAFRALALMPGIEIVDRERAVVTLQRDDLTHARTKTIVIDTAAGLILSFAEEERGEPGKVMTSSQTVSLSVVDAAPIP